MQSIQQAVDKVWVKVLEMKEQTAVYSREEDLARIRDIEMRMKEEIKGIREHNRGVLEEGIGKVRMEIGEVVGRVEDLEWAVRQRIEIKEWENGREEERKERKK